MSHTSAALRARHDRAIPATVWLRRFRFHCVRHPPTGRARDQRRSHPPGSQEQRGASTQNGFSALLFLTAMCLTTGRRARKCDRAQAAASAGSADAPEVKDVPAELDREVWLMASLMYCAGLRLTECLPCRLCPTRWAGPRRGWTVTPYSRLTLDSTGQRYCFGMIVSFRTVDSERLAGGRRVARFVRSRRSRGASCASSRSPDGSTICACRRATGSSSSEATAPAGTASASTTSTASDSADRRRRRGCRDRGLPLGAHEMDEKLKPVTPGELLLEEFLLPMGITSTASRRRSACPRSASVRSSPGARRSLPTRPAPVPLLRSLQRLRLRAQAAYDTESRRTRCRSAGPYPTRSASAAEGGGSVLHAHRHTPVDQPHGGRSASSARARGVGRQSHRRRR